MHDCLKVGKSKTAGSMSWTKLAGPFYFPTLQVIKYSVSLLATNMIPLKKKNYVREHKF